eukprot:237618_1
MAHRMRIMLCLSYTVNIMLFATLRESGLSEGDDAWFCKACATESSRKYGNTCWGVLPYNDLNRGCRCSCNSEGLSRSGLYYGGFDTESCNVCTCYGGAFSGWKDNGISQSNLPSVGLRLSILVCKEDITA